MNDIVKSFAIGVGIIALLTLFVLGIALGGFLSWVLLVIALVFASYFIGSEVLSLHRSNKAFKEKYRNA